MKASSSIFLQIFRSRKGFCLVSRATPIREYFQPALQCPRHQGHGHMAKFCPGSQRCKTRSGSHNHKDCTSRLQPQCADCGDDHLASHGKCPKKQSATWIDEQELQQEEAPKRHSPPPNTEIMCLTLAMSSSTSQNGIESHSGSR